MPGLICDEHGAAWSADGKRIAFVTTTADEQAQIVSADAAGSDLATLTKVLSRRQAHRVSVF